MKSIMTLPNLIYKKNQIKHEFIEKQIDKMKEEVAELENYRDDDNLVEEIFDIIQISISILKNMDIDMSKASGRHRQKLYKRGWQYEDLHVCIIKKD